MTATPQEVTSVWTSYQVEVKIVRSLCLQLANKKVLFQKSAF